MSEVHVPQRILVATGNQGKIREFETLLRPLLIDLLTLTEFPHISEPEETGSTFTANAKLKASYYAVHAGEWSIAAHQCSRRALDQNIRPSPRLHHS